MKKFIFGVALAAALTLAACGNKAQTEAETIEAENVEAVEETVDTVAEYPEEAVAVEIVEAEATEEVAE